MIGPLALLVMFLHPFIMLNLGFLHSREEFFFFLVSVSFPGILSLFTSGEQGTGPDQNSASNYMKDKILPFSEGLQLLG